jgi:uncharacterized protein
MKPFERKLLKKIFQRLSEKEFIIITGARQTGKTTMLNQIQDYLISDSKKSVFYLTLEDPSILARLNQHPEYIFDFVMQTEGEKTFVLIDEIQYLDNPSNFLKLLFDKHHKSLKIIATGSSAFYLDQKFTDSLAGRKILFELSTLDFDEYILFRSNDDALRLEVERTRTNETYRSARRTELEVYFNEYLTYGGYPAVALAENHQRKLDMLSELTGSFLKRDIDEANIQVKEKFYKLLLILADQTGSLLNVNELSRLLSLSVTAVNNYIYTLQKCFHISLLKPFNKNLRKELTKMPKVYFNDLGFRNSLLKHFSPVDLRIDKGVLIENYAFNRAKSLFGSDAIHFWRTTDGNEIDLVISTGYDEGLAMEIKYNEKSFDASRYKKFTNAYPDYDFSFRAYKSDSNKHSLMSL